MGKRGSLIEQLGFSSKAKILASDAFVIIAIMGFALTQVIYSLAPKKTMSTIWKPRDVLDIQNLKNMEEPS